MPARTAPTAPPPTPPDQSLVAGVAEILAAGLAASVALGLLTKLLAPAGLTASSVAIALRSVLRPPSRLSPAAGPTRDVLRPGPAETRVLAQEAGYDAAYLVAAARRIQGGIDAGATLRQAADHERTYAEMHTQAQDNRRIAARRVDRVSAKHGLVLGWKAVLDARTSPECRAANGKNYSVLRPPLLGYPGAVHPHCRCRSTRPYPGAGFVDATTATALDTTAA